MGWKGDVNTLVGRIRRNQNPEGCTMKLSRVDVSLAAVLVVVPALLVSAFAEGDARRPTQAVGQVPENNGPENRQLRESGASTKATIRQSDPNAPTWNPLIPAAIPIRVSGTAVDETGKAVPGATIALYPT